MLLLSQLRLSNFKTRTIMIDSVSFSKRQSRKGNCCLDDEVQRTVLAVGPFQVIFY